MPRPINSSTTLGKLRSTLGLSAQRFADKIGVSLSLIKKLETGVMPLTNITARKICYEFFVDVEWLLNGDPSSEVCGLNDGAYDAKGVKDFARWYKNPELAPPVVRNSIKANAEQCAADCMARYMVFLQLAINTKGGSLMPHIGLDMMICLKDMMSRYFPGMNGRDLTAAGDQILNHAAPSSARKGRR